MIKRGESNWLISLCSLVIFLALLEVSIRIAYYQKKASYPTAIEFAIRHVQDKMSAEANEKFIRETWKSSFAERGLPVPASGPREGVWGRRIFPKDNQCEPLRYCERAQHIPGLIKIEKNGFQYAGNQKDPALKILILGGSVAAGAHASSIKETYFYKLAQTLKENSFDAEIDVLAAGGWSSYDELTAFKYFGLSHRPAIAIFLNGLNDLSLPGKSLSSLIAEYLQNMEIAKTLAVSKGIKKVIFVLQPFLLSKKQKSSMEREIIQTADKLPEFTAKLEDYDKIRNGLEVLANHENVYFIDAGGIFDNEKYTTFADYWHFSDPGHTLLAKKISQDLIQILKDEKPLS